MSIELLIGVVGILAGVGGIGLAMAYPNCAILGKGLIFVGFGGAAAVVVFHFRRKILSIISCKTLSIIITGLCVSCIVWVFWPSKQKLLFVDAGWPTTDMQALKEGRSVQNLIVGIKNNSDSVIHGVELKVMSVILRADGRGGRFYNTLCEVDKEPGVKKTSINPDDVKNFIVAKYILNFKSGPNIIEIADGSIQRGMHWGGGKQLDDFYDVGLQVTSEDTSAAQATWEMSMTEDGGAFQPAKGQKNVYR